MCATLFGISPKGFVNKQGDESRADALGGYNKLNHAIQNKVVKMKTGIKLKNAMYWLMIACIAVLFSFIVAPIFRMP
jgi:hypothetical protein